MRVIATEEKIQNTGTDLIAVPFRQGRENPAFDALNKTCRKGLEELARVERFKGQADRILAWQGRLGGSTVRVIVLGMGSETGPSSWRRSVARAVRYGANHRLTSMAIYVDAPSAEGQLEEARWTAEAMVLAAYRFRRYKSKGLDNPPPKSCLIGAWPAITTGKDLRQAIRAGKAAGDGVALARDLVNEPANILSPAALADRAEALAGKKKLDCLVLDAAAIADRKMELLRAVAAGSNREPRLIHLTYHPEEKPLGSVALVGKGVTFDSGGLCVKPPKSMYTMKTDMAGAGVVLGIMSALKTLKPRVTVHGIIPATDNSVGAAATRPGDVIKSLEGLTVEVLNTDAEGRLILADALTYAARLKPNLIVDHATLTGACVAALGNGTAGLFTPDDALAENYLTAAKGAGESMWRLPLIPELDGELKSDVADLRNIGGQYGGAITAALFLKRFVSKRPWIHIDIAGPARLDKLTPLCPRGGSGYGVLTGLEYLCRL